MLRVTDGIRNPKVMVATREAHLQSVDYDIPRRGPVRMVGPLGGGGMTEEDFGHSVLSLLRQRPGAAEKLE